MASPAFSQADFANWNQTTSLFHLPKKLVGRSKLSQLRAELVRAIGETKVSGVQALSGHAFRVQFKSASWRHQFDINGIGFRGVTITPRPAYEEVKSVFVDRAPFQMPDQMIVDALAPYGRVLSVKSLTIQGFAAVKSGTRMVSMVISKAIPAELRVAGFQLAFKYRGQDPTCFACHVVGHTAGNCPKSRKKRSGGGGNASQRSGKGHSTRPLPQQGKVASDTSKTPAVTSGAAPLANPPAGAASQRDLREVLNASKSASKKPLPKGPPSFDPPHTFAVDLSSPAGEGSAARPGRKGKGGRPPVASTVEQSSTAESPPQRDSFDFTMEVAANPAAPATSEWSAKYNRTVSQEKGKGLQVVIPNPPSADKAIPTLVTRRRRNRGRHAATSVRLLGRKTGHSSSSESEESDSPVRRPVHKRSKPVEVANTTPTVQAHTSAIPGDGPWAPSSRPLQVPDLDECLTGASVVDPFADVDTMADVTEGNTSVPSVQESGEVGGGASQDVPSQELPASSSVVGSTQELLAAQVALPPDLSSDGETPGTEISRDEAPPSRVSELLIEELPFLNMEF